MIASHRGRPRRAAAAPHPPARGGPLGAADEHQQRRDLGQRAPHHRQGAAWFAAIGTEGSKGTKIFSLVGKVNNTGLVEVPDGHDAAARSSSTSAAASPGGKAFKAVQTGGPSGGCLPADRLDLPVDFDSLARRGP